MKNYIKVCIYLIWFLGSCFLLPNTGYAKTDNVTGLECSTSETLWIYEFGDRGAHAAPINADSQKHGPYLESWGSPPLAYITAKIIDLPDNITKGTTLESYAPASGGASIPLGNFSQSWPAPGQNLTENSNFKPAAKASADNDYISDLSGSGFKPDNEGDDDDLFHFLSAAAFKGELNYFVVQAANLKYLRVSICSKDAVPAPPEVIEEPASITKTETTSKSTSGSVQQVEQKEPPANPNTQNNTPDPVTIEAVLPVTTKVVEEQDQVKNTGGIFGSGFQINFTHPGALLIYALLGLIFTFAILGKLYARAKSKKSKNNSPHQDASLTNTSSDITGAGIISISSNSNNAKAKRPRLKKPKQTGLVFPGSAMVPGQVPAGGVGSQMGAGNLVI